jgi:hypothetical protein
MKPGETVVSEAEKYVGYEARPGTSTIFGERTGHDGSVWSGSFIDTVIFDAGLHFPSCVQTGSGLAECIKERRWHARPKPGDVVFFSFPTDGGFGMLHAGIVADTAAWNTKGVITTIEAQINSGLPKGRLDKTGVYKRTRSTQVILGFGRPRKLRKPVTVVKPAVIATAQVRPGLKPNGHVRAVQDGLAREAGLRNATPGVFDAVTKEAYARFQRRLGIVGDQADGTPDLNTLRRLGELTGLFTVR